LRAVTTATRLHDAIAELAGFNDDPEAGGITREVYTPTYAAALEHVAAWMSEAGLEVRLDAVGNLFGRWQGAEPGAPRVITGSHVDTTLNAGRYDGVLGVLGAIEAVHLLRDAGTEPRRPIELVAWAGEEPRFGTRCATHSGATPMRLRRDALAGASEAMVALERIARGSPSGTTVGTVGVLLVRPGAIDVVPGEVELDVDVRDSDRAARTQVVDASIAAAREIAARRGLELEVAPIVEDAPVACDPRVVEAAEDAARELGLASRRMISGAYHDAMIMGARVPIGMIFVPSAGGISHHPDEFTEPADLERGVLAGTLARLAA
jgi:acetylornithine deacetylase/succinyl-diaminopimelate desuccinylase-like protein